MKRSISTIFALLALGLGFGACESEGMRFGDPGKFRNKTQYFKDHKGNCFAVIGIRQTGCTTMNGIGLTLVPEENCK